MGRKTVATVTRELRNRAIYQHFSEFAGASMTGYASNVQREE
ncbi:hypothetical protein STBHUCCB_p1810 (plasmid) [Salmonella enterica subsp. enterica serovar Typhi str. P-stx-12]|nr:hypothetical protein STBHUCCB_p1810 [Salmonella enterica subsp. enterica serovar Typhi str. P-stx-12]EPI70786.1 hypothetical protein A671_02140 [Salmonella enterica subsp. enterica serovar Dublin str. DG22]